MNEGPTGSGPNLNAAHSAASAAYGTSGRGRRDHLEATMAKKKTVTEKTAKVESNGMMRKLMTPEAAKRILERGGSNRDVKKDFVTLYAHLMSTGKWDGRVSPIMLRPDGSVADGQHRLMAVVSSGVDVWMYIIENVTDDMVYGYAVDTAAQSPADRMLRLGGTKVGNKEREIATAIVRSCGGSSWMSRTERKRWLDQATIRVLGQWGEEIALIVQHKRKNTRGVAAASILAGFAYAMIVKGIKSRDKVLDLLARWLDGDGLPVGLRSYRDFVLQSGARGIGGAGKTSLKTNLVMSASLVMKAMEGKCGRLYWLDDATALENFKEIADIVNG